MDDERFVEASQLSVIAPQATEIETKDLFAVNTTDNEGQRIVPLASIEQRSLLYFDEQLRIYIVLKTSALDLGDLKPLFERLSISLELRASGAAPRNSGGQDESREASPNQQEDVIWTGTLVAVEDPTIIAPSGDKKETDNELLAIWEIKALLSRPRIRLQSPMITFKASAALQPRKEQLDEALSDPYLPSGVPQSENLFEPLRSHLTAKEKVPRLTRSRLHNVKPFDGLSRFQPKTMKVHVPDAFRALPAISSRIRYHRSNHFGAKITLIASLELETAPFSRDDIELTSVDLQLFSGSVMDLGKGQIPKIPLRCKSLDNTVFLYRLSLDGLHEDTSMTMFRTLEITVNASVLTSDRCRPLIKMHWRTRVDFSSALNPTYNAPKQPMHRNNKPQSLSVPAIPIESSETLGRSRAVSVSDSGVTITFTAPPRAHLQEPFVWDLLVVNGSSKVKHLTLTPITQRHAGNAKVPPPPMIERKKADLADAIIDESVLYAMQKSSVPEPVQIISLSANVEIGPLDPGACYSTHLKFLALGVGHFQIDAVKVVDLISQDVVDIKDLPDIIVVEYS